MNAFPRRLFPCDECPIRADNADNPKSMFPACRWDALSASVNAPQMGDVMFGCHKGAPGTDEDLACAGWLAQFGGGHPTVRLAVFTGRLPVEALSPGSNWPPLHESWQAVVEAQTSETRGGLTEAYAMSLKGELARREAGS